MRTFLLLFPLLLLKNELFFGDCWSLEREDVDEDKDPFDFFFRPGSELYRESSLTFNLTVNILNQLISIL
jgi:hypothetical protein